jgi:hypothetical protein
MLDNIRKYGTKALIGLGSMGKGSNARRQAAQAARAAYRRSAPTGPPVPSAVPIAPMSGGYGGAAYTAASNTATANARQAQAAQRQVAKSRAMAARDASLYSSGRRRAAIGGGIVAGGAITANPKSNQSRTAPFGNNVRRTAGQPIQSPRGTGRYA